MIVQRIKKILIERGFLLTLILSLTFLLWGYGRLLQYPNSKYFAAEGDGLQAYYGAIYHVKHDDSYWRSYGMNHPYGEQVFFTGGQPLVANIIKLVSNVVDISDYTVAILNFIMLFSIVLSALCLYLLLKHLKLNWLFASLMAVAIAYLSPQIARMGGHFSLTYEFAIPLFMLGLLKFHEAPNIRRSIAIGLLSFFIAGTHFYFFALYALLSFFYWAGLFLAKDKEFGKFSFAAKHAFIQLILPFLLIQGLLALTDDVQDRTTFPSGYLTYVSNFFGVFFPPANEYRAMFDWFADPVFPEWEGRAYIGIIGVIVMTGITALVLKNILNKEFRHVFTVVDHRILNIFFWASFAALLLSFGYPFIMEEKQTWLAFAGPLKQFRGIGRFAWLFFYVINIIAAYKIYNWACEKRPLARYLLLAGSVYLVSYDSWNNNEDLEAKLNNLIPGLNDRANLLPENKWLHALRPDDYQAIIPLPYFHIGSENIGIHTESAIVRDVFVTSVKTGLPMTSVILSRVSMSQSFKNLAMIKEPYRKLKYVNDLASRKPFLVLARESELNEDERKFLARCSKLMESPRFGIYKLEVEDLETISDGLFKEARRKFETTRTFAQGEFFSSDSLPRIVYNGFDDSLKAAAMTGKGCYEGPLLKYNTMYFDTLPNWKEGEYVISFWMDKFNKDIYPRAVIELAFFDVSGSVYGTRYFSPSEAHRLAAGSWALIEAKFSLRNASDKVKLTIWTDHYLDENMLFRADELLIRPADTDVFTKISGQKITLNNRTYLAKQTEQP